MLNKSQPILGKDKPLVISNEQAKHGKWQIVRPLMKSGSLPLHGRIVTAWCFAAVCLLTSCASPDAQNNVVAQPVRLLSPLPFDHLTKTGPITRSQAASLLNEKVKLDSKDADDYVFLVLPTTPVNAG